MTLVYHHLVYMIMKKILSVKDSMLEKSFAEKLAIAKTKEQLNSLAESVIVNQLKSPVRKGWEVPRLEDMELEMMHLVSYWNDKNVSIITE